MAQEVLVLKVPKQKKICVWSGVTCLLVSPRLRCGCDRCERNCRRHEVRSDAVCTKRVTVASVAKGRCQGHRPVGVKRDRRGLHVTVLR